MVSFTRITFHRSGTVVSRSKSLIVESMRKRYVMAISYNGLWKLLIDKGMNKGDLQEAVGISSSTMAKMTKGEAVSMSILERICDELDCDFGDLVSYVRNKE